MTPRADFACTSRACATDEGAPVYELPVDASHCPRGHKRLKRLFNAVAVIGTRPTQPEGDPRLTSSSHFQRSTASLQPMYDRRDQLKAPDDMRSYTVPVGTAGQMVGSGMGKGRPMREMEIAQVISRDKRQYGGLVSPPSVMKAINRLPIPTMVRGRET